MYRVLTLDCKPPSYNWLDFCPQLKPGSLSVALKTVSMFLNSVIHEVAFFPFAKFVRNQPFGGLLGEGRLQAVT